MPAHHITQRGNNRQDVFFVDDDRRVYLQLLQEQAGRYGLEVLAYSLMTNHVHLVAIPQAEDALAKAVGRTHFRYTQYLNRFHGRSGHLWQGRFYSCALEGRHVWTAIKYVELNPMRAKLCRRAWEYVWSSAAAHTHFGRGVAPGTGGRVDAGGVGSAPTANAHGPAAGQRSLPGEVGGCTRPPGPPPAGGPPETEGNRQGSQKAQRK
ncbi:MAG: transposase [Planctomycetes bacterium]|nr:transposase [Planctomycetota bacterium]